MIETKLIEIVVLQNFIASESNCTKYRCKTQVFKHYVQLLSKSLFKALARYEKSVLLL